MIALLVEFSESAYRDINTGLFGLLFLAVVWAVMDEVDRRR